MTYNAVKKSYTVVCQEKNYFTRGKKDFFPKPNHPYPPSPSPSKIKWSAPKTNVLLLKKVWVPLDKWMCIRFFLSRIYLFIFILYLYLLFIIGFFRQRNGGSWYKFKTLGKKYSLVIRKSFISEISHFGQNGSFLTLVSPFFLFLL